MAVLLFCDLEIVLFGEIRPVLLPSCSLVTHCSKTQWVIRRRGESSGFLKNLASYLPVWNKSFSSEVSSGFRGKCP